MIVLDVDFWRTLCTCDVSHNISRCKNATAWTKMIWHSQNVMSELCTVNFDSWLEGNENFFQRTWDRDLCYLNHAIMLLLLSSVNYDAIMSFHTLLPCAFVEREKICVKDNATKNNFSRSLTFRSTCMATAWFSTMISSWHVTVRFHRSTMQWFLAYILQ